MKIVTLLAALGACPSATAVAQDADAVIEAVIEVDGVSFYSWTEFLQSPQFRGQGLRCLTPDRAAGTGIDLFGAPSDCSFNSTTISPDYEPGEMYEIQVVWHVIQRTNGTGFVPKSEIDEQMEILNEDFSALAGTPGAPGSFAGIRFRLATVDPQGDPTDGVTYSSNNTWYNDSGQYWNQLAWDTERYLNIYTNSASGALGYVPDLPQGGIVGQNRDRVVMLWSTVGRNAPIGPPYNQGRTTTHEVGHYLGLFHTFDGGCGSNPACYTTGDLICDTQRQSSPTFGCPGNPTSCGSPDPKTNYMDYSDDTCMNEFTPEQVNRMRCTLINWRPLLAQPVGDIGNRYCSSSPNSTGSPSVIGATGGVSVAGDQLTLTASSVPAGQPGIFYHGPNQLSVPFGNGTRCVGGTVVRLSVGAASGSGVLQQTLDLSSAAGVSANATRNFQAWFRDPAGSPSTFDLSDALEITFLP